MGLLASTLLAAGLGVGGTAVAAGPAAADTGLKMSRFRPRATRATPITIGTVISDRDHDRKNHQKWCETHGHWKKERHGNHWHWKRVSDRDGATAAAITSTTGRNG